MQTEVCQDAGEHGTAEVGESPNEGDTGQEGVEAG